LRSRTSAGDLIKLSGAVFEAPAFVPGLDDLAVVGEAIGGKTGSASIIEAGPQGLSSCEPGKLGSVHLRYTLTRA
jgi:hypothetical protein